MRLSTLIARLVFVTSLAAATATFVPNCFADSDNQRLFGDSRLIGLVPLPGYPEAVAVNKGIVYVTTPANLGIPANNSASVVYGLDIRTGAVVKTFTIKGQTSTVKGLACAAFDDHDNIYVLDFQQGVFKINVNTGQQTTYATNFPIVFHSAFNPIFPLLLNDLAFGPSGELYISDTFQATIWRVPPGGGTPEVWFQDPRLDGPIGPNGLRVSPDGKSVYVITSADGNGVGRMWTLPLVSHPTAAELQLFTTFDTGSRPDGFAFGRSGRLYVALASLSQIAVLNPDGTQVMRLTGPTAQNLQNPAQSVPWANMANIAFNDEEGTLLVSNHATSAPVTDSAVFDVYVNDKAGMLFPKGVGN